LLLPPEGKAYYEFCFVHAFWSAGLDAAFLRCGLTHRFPQGLNKGSARPRLTGAGSPYLFKGSSLSGMTSSTIIQQ
jgi:hypothetical protein